MVWSKKKARLGLTASRLIRLVETMYGLSKERMIMSELESARLKSNLEILKLVLSVSPQTRDFPLSPWLTSPSI